MRIARVELGQLIQQTFVQIAPVAEFAAVEFLQQAALDLGFGKVRTRHHDVVAGFARHQLGVQDLVVVVGVVAHLDAGFFLKILDRVLGNVVRPVVDVEHLGIGCPGVAGKQKCAGRQGQAELFELEFHGIHPFNNERKPDK